MHQTLFITCPVGYQNVAYLNLLLLKKPFPSPLWTIYFIVYYTNKGKIDLTFTLICDLI